MKILLNGATCGTNFGDFLFAKIFQDSIGEIVGKENVYWYKSRYALSSFFEDRLDNHQEYDLKDIDALVYISGGYFCGEDYTWKDYVRRYLRYFHIGVKCIIRKIPYAVIGLEVAQSKSKIMNFVQKKILKNAELIIVRNKESLKSIEKYGIKDAVCTADTAFLIEKEWFSDRKIHKEIIDCKKRILLFHISPDFERNKRLIEKIVPIINRFLENHPEYAVLLTADQYSDKQDEALDEMAKYIHCDTIIKNHYDDPVALCGVIDHADVIVTSKLHVGIVGASLNKSVISFCGHAEKIIRLYSQLKETGRTMPLDELNEQVGLDMLEKYHELPIMVSDEIKEKAKSNLDRMNLFIQHVCRNK